MEYICIGRISTTHGLKGEIKIRSNFKYKEKAFVVGNSFYIGRGKEKFVINSYRKHQEYDMVIFNTLDDISQVIKYKGDLIYMKREDLCLDLNQYIDEDYIGSICIYNDKEFGKVSSIIDGGSSNYLFCILGNKKIYIPRNDAFIEKFILDKKELYFKNIEGLI